jgi:hypothetical protein
MIGLLPTTAIFLATAPTDLRKAYDGLAVLVRQSLGQDPLSGSLFVFCNRRKDRIKMGDIGYAPVGWSKGLFGGRKRKEPARATDARNCCSCWEASTWSRPKNGSGIGAGPKKKNRFSAGL